VIAMAKTPSLKASTRLVSTLQRYRPRLSFRPGPWST
jgi:hypothetical protein